MEHSLAEIPTKQPQLSDGGGSEDRLSALPDDILIQILIKLLDTAVAARASVLSSRWRRLWRLLPELCFGPDTDPHGVHAALESNEAPALRILAVGLQDASAESVAAWLPVAAHRLSGALELVNTLRQNRLGDMTGTIELPCFENATSISLDLGFLGLAVPSLGVFAGLTDLCLDCVMLRGPCMLGDAVSSPRCPALRKLAVRAVWGLRNFAIHSDSLLEIQLHAPHNIQQLTVIAPALKLLDVLFCFSNPYNNHLVASISAPQLVSLKWRDDFDPRFVQFGEMKNLQRLTTHAFRVYEQDNYEPNNYCLRLLRHFELVQSLTCMLVYEPDITNKRYLMEDITSLPNITNIVLMLKPNGHSFGASVFYILRMCIGVRKLVLEFHDIWTFLEVQPVCPSGCVCEHPSDWKTKELALNRLQELVIVDLRGTEHEAALIKRLFDWAIVLEKMTITFDCLVAESEAKEFFQMLQSFSRPEICMEGPHFAYCSRSNVI